MGVRTWHRAVLGVILVGAVAVAGIALNFTLLRLTQDAHDPVGKLSPRAVFMGGTTTRTETGPVRTTTVPEHSSGHDPDDDGDRDD